MSFIQETIRCKHCKFEMNIVTGTFGYGIPEKCPNCSYIFTYDYLSSGWHARNDKTPEEIEQTEILINRIKSNECTVCGTPMLKEGESRQLFTPNCEHSKGKIFLNRFSTT